MWFILKSFKQYFNQLKLVCLVTGITVITSSANAQNFCISCSSDSIEKIWSKAVTPQDSMIALIATLDNYQPSLGTNEIKQTIQDIDYLNRLNNIYKQYDIKPYLILKDAWILWMQNSQVEAIEKFKAAIELFDEQKKIMDSGILQELRNLFSKAGMHEERLKYYQAKLKYYQEFGPIENTAMCYHAIGGYYLNYRTDYDLAISNYLKSAEVYKDFDIGGFINEISVAGWAYYLWGNNERALHFLQQAVSLQNIKENKSHFDVGLFMGNKVILSLIEKYNRNYYRALLHIDEGLATQHGGANYAIIFAICLTEKAGIYIALKDTAKAKPYLQQASFIRDSADIPIVSTSGIFELDYYLFQYNLLTGETALAEISLLKAHATADEAGSIRLTQKYRKELFNFYKSQNKLKESSDFAMLYIIADDSIKKAQDAYNIAKFENELQEISSAKKIKEIHSQRITQRNYFVFGGILLLLFSAGLVSRLQYVRKTKQKLEQQNKLIEAARERAERSEQFEQQFLANMSHEIRTPMNTVSGMTELLIHNKHLPEQEKYLTAIQHSADTLLHIINDILDLSKVEAGKLELENIDFSIADVVEQVIQSLHIKAEEKGLELITEIQHDIQEVVIGDPHRLKQILINLCNNAIKFTEKGSVQLKVDVVLNATDNQTLRFSIIDTGIGIPPEKIDTIFENFTQAHASDSRKYGGTGLGLSIAKQLVELQGGEINVQSKVGAGTTFSFDITYAFGTAENVLQDSSAFTITDASALNGLRILLVDDNEYNRIVAIDSLRTKLDVEIDTAVNGRDAIDKLQVTTYDVVLMDVQMPVMDGYEATRYIRNRLHEPLNQIPIIALTASVIRSDLDKCFAAGMSGFVPKPFKLWQLLKALSDATGRKMEMDKKLIHPTITQNKQTVSNLSFLRELTDANPTQLKQYIEKFIDNTTQQIQKMEEALQNKDYASLASLAHMVKPHFKMMGIISLADIIMELDMSAREEKNIDEMPAMLQTIKQTCEQAYRELQSAELN